MSALLFASVHLYLINFLPIFLIGVLLARLYERTGSLAAPIVAHATANAAVAVLAMWVAALRGVSVGAGRAAWEQGRDRR